MKKARYLAAIEAHPWLLSVGEHLPQGDSEHPGVTGVREGAGLQAFGSTPGEGPAGERWEATEKEKLSAIEKLEVKVHSKDGWT